MPTITESIAPLLRSARSTTRKTRIVAGIVATLAVGGVHNLVAGPATPSNSSGRAGSIAVPFNQNWSNGSGADSYNAGYDNGGGGYYNGGGGNNAGYYNGGGGYSSSSGGYSGGSRSASNIGTASSAGSSSMISNGDIRSVL